MKSSVVLVEVIKHLPGRHDQKKHAQFGAFNTSIIKLNDLASGKVDPLVDVYMPGLDDKDAIQTAEVIGRTILDYAKASVSAGYDGNVLTLRIPDTHDLNEIQKLRKQFGLTDEEVAKLAKKTVLLGRDRSTLWETKKAAEGFLAAGVDKSFLKRMLLANGFLTISHYKKDKIEAVKKFTPNPVIENDLGLDEASKLTAYLDGLPGLFSYVQLKNDLMRIEYLKALKQVKDKSDYAYSSGLDPIVWYLRDKCKIPADKVALIAKYATEESPDEDADEEAGTLSWPVLEWLGRRAAPPENGIFRERRAYGPGGRIYTYDYLRRLNEIRAPDLTRGVKTPIELAFKNAEARIEEEMLKAPKRKYKKAVAEDDYVKQIRDSHDLIREGRTLHHCVGGRHYQDACAKGTSAIYRIRTVDADGKLDMSTIEIVRDKLTRRWHLAQHYGFADSNPSADHAKLLEKWMRANYIDGKSARAY